MIDDSVQVAMLNRGRVVWVTSSEVAEQLKKGWIRIQNPTRDYYPEMDQAYNKVLEDPRVDRTNVILSDEHYVDRLGIIQI